MPRRLRAAFACLRVWLPHYWKVALGVLSLALTIGGFARGSSIGFVGLALLVASVIATANDVVDVRRRLGDLYALPGSGDLGEIELTGGYEPFERIAVPLRGIAITSDIVNERFRSTAELVVSIGPPYKPPRRVRWAQELARAESRRRGIRDFNDAKVRLCSDLLPGNDWTTITVQRTRFLFSATTNDLATMEFRSKERGMTQLSAEDIAFPRGRLPTLAGSECSNHVGVDTLALTRRGELIVGVQTVNNSQSPGLLAPTGSGSADWSDLEVAVNAGEGFLGFLRRAMARELAEECGLASDRVLETTLIGFARFLHRGGKPQFFEVTRVDANADDLLRTRRERLYVLDHHVERLDMSSGKLGAGSMVATVAKRGRARVIGRGTS